MRRSNRNVRGQIALGFYSRWKAQQRTVSLGAAADMDRPLNANSLEQRAVDVQHGRGQQPSEAHLIAELGEPMGDQKLGDGDDTTQAEANENLRPRAPMGRFAVFWVQHNVRGTFETATINELSTQQASCANLTETGYCNDAQVQCLMTRLAVECIVYAREEGADYEDWCCV